MRRGYDEVVDADLSGYFDSIPHAELMRSVARRVSDRHLLALVKQWLVVPVEEDDGLGGWRRTTRAKDEKRGVPQGAPISPLLANFYSLRRLPADSVDFLGYTIGRCYSTQTGRAYIGTRPSKKSIQRITARISDLTARRMLLLEADLVVQRLNRLLVGWGNYFCLGPVSKAYCAVDGHTRHRLRRWLCEKHKVGTKGAARYPDEYLYEQLDLVRLSMRTRNLPWAKA